MSKKQVIRTVALVLLVAGAQVPTARADFAFGPRVDMGPAVNSPYDEGNPIVSRNGLELYFFSARPGGYGGNDIWMSKRASAAEPWGPPVNLGPGINGADNELAESISSDGLTLYISASGGSNPAMYTATRATLDAPWGPRVKIDPLLGQAGFAIISPDDLELYFISNREGGMGGYDVWVSTRATPNDPWGSPVNLGPMVNTTGLDCPASISPDGLILFILSDRPGGFGGYDTWMARRPSKGAPWNEAVNLGPSFNTPNTDELSCVSADGRWAYAFGTREMWMAPIIPIVDFNGDGKVDGKDVLSMVTHWGTDDSVCDVGPFAWGDGTVGLEDLTVLAGYLGKEVIDHTLIAHWALDEAEGTAAHESVSGRADVVLGGLWQPEGGQVGGAIQFDGVDDCVITPFILNPADGPFSVVAWVKGGIPGQVVLSQIDSADWLCADPSEGRLMTSLVPPTGRIVPPPLVSELVITDGNWHRIGFVWDGSHRKLYVDGVIAAEDTQPPLAGSVDGLYIGCGKAMEAGTYWSGLIDEVRIYNRAVRP